MKTKTFDCIRMKDRIQRELREEYAARKAEFPSFADFLNATANESEEIRRFREWVARGGVAGEA